MLQPYISLWPVSVSFEFRTFFYFSLCQVMQLVASSNSPSASSTSNTGSSGALLNTIAQTLQVMNSANSLSGIAQLLTAPIDGNKTGDPSHTGASQGGKPLLAQVIQAIGALSANSASASGSGATGGNTSPYNPLSAIFDYFSGSGAAHLLPARRKKPMDLEDLFTSFSSPSSERTSSASGWSLIP